MMQVSVVLCEPAGFSRHPHISSALIVRLFTLENNTSSRIQILGITSKWIRGLIPEKEVIE